MLGEPDTVVVADRDAEGEYVLDGDSLRVADPDIEAVTL